MNVVFDACAAPRYSSCSSISRQIVAVGCGKNLDNDRATHKAFSIIQSQI
jgi:hypothetical protein